MKSVKVRLPERSTNSDVLSHLKALKAHIEDYLPLASAHMTSFFTSNHWQSLVPVFWQEELLQLTDEEIASKISQV